MDASLICFSYVKTIQVPGEAQPEYVMRLARGDATGN